MLEPIRILKNDELHLEHGIDGNGLDWRFERCKSNRCRGRRVVVSFSVSNIKWKEVTGGDNSVLCLPCFDEMAQSKQITYSITATHIVSWYQ